MADPLTPAHLAEIEARAAAPHRWAGLCPEPSDRDPACPACQALDTNDGPALVAEIRRLRAALTPFARLAAIMAGGTAPSPLGDGDSVPVRMGWLRDARRALEGEVGDG